MLTCCCITSNLNVKFGALRHYLCWSDYLVKMVVLPQCLYTLQYSPVLQSVPRQFFHSIESLMYYFIWGRSRAKPHLSSLQHPNQLARMALLDLFLYYIAGQFRILRSWFLDEQLPPFQAHLAHVLNIRSFWSLLKYPHLFTKNLLPIHKLACQVWKQAEAISNFTDDMADMPLLSNSGMPKLNFFQDTQCWESHVVTNSKSYK